MKREIQPHRFNSGFEWKPVPRLGGLATAEQCDAFDRDGFVLMEGVLDAAEFAAVRDEVDDFEDASATSCVNAARCPTTSRCPTRSPSPS